MGRYLRRSLGLTRIPAQYLTIRNLEPETDNPTHFYHSHSSVLCSGHHRLYPSRSDSWRRRRWKPWTSRHRLGCSPSRRPRPAPLTTSSLRPVPPSRRSLPGYSPSRRTAPPSRSSGSSSPRCRSSSSRSAKYVTIQNPSSALQTLPSTRSAVLTRVEFAQVNREILMEEDKIKRETEAAKAPVDSTTLQLHNLLYEKNHYVKAIRACQDIQTKYPGIELVPEEEFHRAAPDDIREKALAADAAHDLMLKRLNFELVQVVNCCLLQLCLSPSCYLFVCFVV
jgi:hypothetical protein